MTPPSADAVGAFAGRVALVTGAGSGIGLACASALAEAGAAVLVSDLDGDTAERAVAGMVKRGTSADRLAAVECDVTDDAQIERTVALALDRFGRLDHAVNNAGVDVPHRPLAEGPESEWRAITEVDLTGVWRCLRAEIPAMVRGGGGSIVNMSSGAGIMGVEGAAPYCAAKHGVVGLTRAAALDYARQGVRVNAVCPGLIDTPLVTHVLGDAIGQVVDARIPMGRIGAVSDIADSVLWLLSDRSAFVTGIALPVDGGSSITSG